MVSSILQFSMGTILLYYGANFLITGSKTVALKFNISPIIVGITLIAFGTSLPELIVSIIAILRDESGLVMGNVIGSNIANIGLVLGITAIITPIVFSFKKISFDLYFLLCITLLPLPLIYLGDLVFLQGLFFIVLFGGYCWRLYKNDYANDDNNERQNLTSVRNIFLKLILGVVGLGIGANIVVLGAIGITLALGVSSLVIGMSIVALGTSLPELSTSIVAAKQNEFDFVIGNIIGSNIMNIIAVLGFTLMIRPISIEFSEVVTQGIFMVILTLRLFFLIKFRSGITKYSGIIFLIMYSLFLLLNFQFI